ncbi:ligand-binding sensor domain-containing protein [Candidatus Venteria ishoeyi]|uniref:Two component regulator propeller n=1 Tax=Candidatus Venteria ishoeyi TaxID=1899563 RepID=A0A1H6FEY1_9GAMM|nr:two-component regulator propeller domain-containing protein [Candidatus Venteria ishoeyi]SEH08638.1 Two component regulator propeller [Candidatus Venteria ishoeyi]
MHAQRYLSFYYLFLILFSTEAFALTFYPSTPIIGVGERSLISVSDAVTPVQWAATGGQLEPRGNQALYTAPGQPGSYEISARENNGNVSTVMVTVLSATQTTQTFSAQNTTWELFKSRKDIIAMALSPDQQTLWVGTGGGLEEREAQDGSLIRVYTNIDGVLGGVNTIYHAPDGILWIGCGNGLGRRTENGEWTFFNPDNSPLPSYMVTSILADGNGGLWLSMIGYPNQGGIAHYTTSSTWEVLTTANSGLPSNDIQGLAFDKNGEMWAIAYNGDAGLLRKNANDNLEEVPYPGPGLMHRTAAGRWETFTPDNTALPSRYIQSFYIDDENTIWISTGDQGLVSRTQEGNWETFNTNNSAIPDNKLHNISGDGQGGLWVGLADGRLARKNADDTWQVMVDPEEPQLSENDANMRGFFVDPQKRFWFGNANGLSRYTDAEGWRHFDTSALPTNFVRALTMNQQGLWVGTRKGGLAQRNTDGIWQVYNPKNSPLPGNDVNTLYSDEQNNLWVGTEKGLARRSADGTWDVFDTGNVLGVPNNMVRAIDGDGAGGVWVGIGTSAVTHNDGSEVVQTGGLAHRDNNGTWTIFTSADSALPADNVTALQADRHGGLWIATADFYYRAPGAVEHTPIHLGGGLAYLDNAGGWTIYNKENSALTVNNIQTLHLDYNEELWVGTGFQHFGAQHNADGGLAHRFTDGSWEVSTAQSSNNVIRDSVMSFAPDGRGGLWVGNHYSGALSHRAQDWIEVLYSGNSGLPGNEIFTLYANGSQELWIGTDHGLARLSFGQKSLLAQQTEDETIKNAVISEKRAAILILPRSSQRGGHRQSASMKAIAGRTAYHALQERGYENEEIYFLSYTPSIDINNDHFSDFHAVDAPVSMKDSTRRIRQRQRDLSINDITQAFTWAKQQGTLSHPLFIFAVANGEENKLKLSPEGENLEANAFAELLNDYQAETDNAVTIVLDAGNAGSLIDELAGNNRIIITSTGDSNAYYQSNGEISFSRYFFKSLQRGKNLFTAFEYAKTQLSRHGNPFDKQLPQLEGDGNGTPNTSVDERMSARYCLNACFETSPPDLTLTPTTQAGILTAGETLNLEAAISGSAGIQKVWALVITPEAALQYTPEGYPLAATPTVEMRETPAGSNIWQGKFNDIVFKGDYNITFMAKDGKSFIHSTTPLTLSLPDGPEPSPPELLAAAPIPSQAIYHDGDTLHVTLPPGTPGQARYTAMTMPSISLIFLFDNLNHLIMFDGMTLPSWNGADVMLEMTVNPAFIRGDYQLYLLEAPEGLNPLAHLDMTQLGMATFRVE